MDAVVKSQAAGLDVQLNLCSAVFDLPLDIEPSAIDMFLSSQLHADAR